MLSYDYNTEQKPRRRWPRIIVVIVIVALGVAAYWNRSFILKPVVSLRVESHLKNAKEAIANDQWQDAYRLSLAAYRMDNRSLEATRILFRSARKIRTSRALETGIALFQHPESSPGDKRDVLAGMLTMRAYPRFAALFQLLDEETRATPDFLYLKIGFLIASSKLDEALDEVEGYFQEGGNQSRFRLLKAQILLLPVQSLENAAKGQQLVAELVSSSDPLAGRAFGLLWDLPVAVIQPDLFPIDLAGRVEQLENTGVREQLILAKIDLARQADNPEHQEKILRQAVKEYGDQEKELLCLWLTDLRRFDLVLEVIDEASGRSSMSLYEHRLRALASIKGREKEAQAWLENPHPEASMILVLTSQARLAHLEGEKSQAIVCWRKALELAQLNQESRGYLWIYQAASDVGNIQVASDALVLASRTIGARLPASRQIQPVVEYLLSKNRWEDLLYLTGVILRQEPTNIVLKNNVAYLSFLLDNPSESPLIMARQLVHDYPAIVGFRTTLALGLMRAGNWDEALSAINDEQLDWSKATDMDKAIRSLVMNDSDWESHLHSEGLRNKERQVLRALREGRDG